MRKDKSLTGGRRAFLKEGMRAVLLAGFASGGILMGLRTLANSGNGQDCWIGLPCRNCAQFHGCGKAEAKSARQEESLRLVSAEELSRGGRSER